MQETGRYISAATIMEGLANQYGIDMSSNSLAGHLVTIFQEASSNHSKGRYDNHVCPYLADTWLLDTNFLTKGIVGTGPALRIVILLIWALSPATKPECSNNSS